MQQNSTVCGEESELKTLLYLEDLAEKKTKVYSRLLTDADLAQAMEKISARHAERKKALQTLLYGKTKGDKKANAGGTSETNGGEMEK